MYYGLEYVENMAGPLFVFNVMFILGAQNAFNLIEINKKNVVAQFSKSAIQLHCPF